MNINLKKLIQENLLLILIFLIAALIRTWDFPNSLILFDDAGRDLEVAEQSLENRTLPLLGIASSVPRFKQGPVTIWFEMMLRALFGHNLTMIGLGFVFLSLLSLVLVYEFCDRYFSQRISIITTFLIALSPLAIVQARMPYHTSPIPLAVILFLIALVRLYQKKPRALFWAVLAWAFLFQFELAIFPTILLIPWVLYRSKELKFGWDKIISVMIGLAIGLLPQIIYDLTHGFSQLGLFVVWVGYRILSLFGGEHSFTINRLRETIINYELYGGRIFTTNQLLLEIVFLALIVGAVVVLVRQFKQKKLTPAWEVVLGFTVILSLGYFLHGSPSEAYFPPYLVVLPLLVAFILNEIFKQKSALLMLLLLLWGLFNLRSLLQQHLFVSNSQPFTYGCSVKDQRQIINFIGQNSGGDFRLETTSANRQFESAFAGYRWLAAERGWQDRRASKQSYYLENKSSPLLNNPDLSVRHFGCLDVYYYR